MRAPLLSIREIDHPLRDAKCSFALYRLTFYRDRVADGCADLEIPCSGMKVDIAGSLRYVQVPEFSSPVWGELATIWHLPVAPHFHPQSNLPTILP